MKFKTTRTDALTPDEIERWATLESTALEANAYQSPYFVLPAMRHLQGSAGSVALVEAEQGGAPQTLAAFAYQTVRGSTLLPCPHLKVYDSEHSYLSTPLVDTSNGASALATLLSGLSQQHRLAAGLLIPQMEQDGPLHQLLNDLLRPRGLQVQTRNPHERATLNPAAASGDELKARLGKKFNEIERQRRRLSECGELQWHMRREATASKTDEATAVDTFLRLEHAGWKGESGTSLRSDSAREAFFRDMSAGFANAGRAMFTELRLQGEPIASTANYVSGGCGFAFKVGWDPQYRKFGPGILNEVELVRHAGQVCADLRVLDSGSEPDSFIEALWPGRRTLISAFVPFSQLGQISWKSAQRLKHVALNTRRWVQTRRQEETTPS